MLIYNNACSVGEANQEHPIYADVVADHYGADIVNNAMSGSCNRRIIRTTIRDLITLKQTHSDIIALIGLTFVSRTELWQPWLPAQGNDGHFSSVLVDYERYDWSQKGFVDTHIPDIYKTANWRVRDYYQQWLVHYHPESIVTDLLTDVIMLACWLEKYNIRYVMFTNGMFPGDNKVGYNSPFVSSLRSEVENNRSILNPWTFSFPDYALQLGHQPKDYQKLKNYGHPGEAAHKDFGNYLINHLKNN